MINIGSLRGRVTMSSFAARRRRSTQTEQEEEN